MKKLSLIFIFLFCIPFFFFGCSQEIQVNSYKIDGVFNETEMSLNVSQSVCYVNNSNNSLDKVCFYLYANAFDEGQQPVSTSYTEKAYPNGESFGNIVFESVCVEGIAADFSVSEPNKNILTVQLQKEIYPEEKVDISMNYTIKLANINHRLGYGENTINFGNFFPIACVYQDGKGFVENGFVANGDPFYSDIANFEVNISCPEKYVVACTGNKTESISNGIKMIKSNAQKVRDFCFVLSHKFQVISGKVGDITVNYYYYDDPLFERHLQTAIKTVSTYQDLFGPYPYQQLSVVKSNFCFGGMEYPNLVMIADQVKDDETYNYVIAHEVAHQWWYGVVGNNEYAEAWVDEGLTEFSTALFFEKNPEYNFNYDTIMQNATDTYKNFVSIYTKINGDVDESMDRDLASFETEPEYVNCIYTKGMLLFDNLRSTMSEKKFFKCLKEYYKAYSFKNSSADSLIKSFCKTSGNNLEPYFRAWIEGRVVFN